MTPIYVPYPDIDFQVPIDDVITQVNDELENHPVSAIYSAAGDGVQRVFHIPPPARYVYDGEDMVVSVDGNTTDGYTMNYYTGNITLNEVPGDDIETQVEYSHVYWPDILIRLAIEAGVSALFPDFYTPVVEELATDGVLYEYALTTPSIESIRQVEHSSTSDEPWSIISSRHYERYWDGGTYYIKFYTAPQAGSIRVHEIARPYMGTEYILMSSRAVAPLVSYVCYHLLNQKMSQRVRSDTAVTTYGGGSLSPRQMNDAANAFYTRYKLQVDATKMRPWMGR